MYNLSTTEVLTINNQTSRCITGFTITFTKQTHKQNLRLQAVRPSTAPRRFCETRKHPAFKTLPTVMQLNCFSAKLFLSSEGCFYLVVHLTPNDGANHALISSAEVNRR